MTTLLVLLIIFSFYSFSEAACISCDDPQVCVKCTALYQVGTERRAILSTCDGRVVQWAQCDNACGPVESSSSQLLVQRVLGSTTVWIGDPSFNGGDFPCDLCTDDSPSSCDGSGENGFCQQTVQTSTCPRCTSNADCSSLPASECSVWSCQSNVCTHSFRPNTFTCRPSKSDCDIAENCTGSSSFCPPDNTTYSGRPCREANGTCDLAEYCIPNGSVASCPKDIFAPSTVTCRAAAGSCDAIETCTGLSKDCPNDGFRKDEICRGPKDFCDPPEVCTGQSKDCPEDIKLTSGYASVRDEDSTILLCGITKFNLVNTTQWIRLEDNCKLGRQKTGQRVVELPYPNCLSNPPRERVRLRCDAEKASWQCEDDE